MSFLCQFITGSLLLQVVPLQIPGMLLFVTIAIANVVFYWAMVLYAVSSEFLLFCVVCWVHLVIGGSTLFQGTDTIRNNMSENFFIKIHWILHGLRHTPSSVQLTINKKQAPYLKFKWQQQDSNPQLLSS